MTFLTALLIIAAVILGLAGIGVAVWSIADTRKQYYEEYMSRRKHDAGD